MVLEIVGCSSIDARLCVERWVGGFAAMVDADAWSRAHIRFGYIQPPTAFWR